MSGAGITIRREAQASELRRLARREPSGKVASRMLAIANVLSGMSRGKSAELAGMGRQTLCDWVHRFNAEGINGLQDRRRAGRPSRLDEAGRKKLAERVASGPDPKIDQLVRWRRIDLKDWLEKEYGVAYSETSVGRILRELGFCRLSTRPAHPKGDPIAQEAFKKTSPPIFPQSSPNTPKTKTSNSGSKTKPVLDKKGR